MSQAKKGRRKDSDDNVWRTPEYSLYSRFGHHEDVQEYAIRQSNDSAQAERPEIIVVPAIRESDMNVTGENTKKKTSYTSNISDHPSIRSHRKKRTTAFPRGNDSTYRSYNTGDKDNASLLQDWNNTSPWRRMGIGMGFNLEFWWAQSTYQHRINAGLILLFVTIMILHLAFGIWLITTSFTIPVPNPYTCETPDCHKAAQWLAEFMDKSVNPCDNFYEYVCGHYHQETEVEGDDFDFALYHSAFSLELGEASLLAKILKNFTNDPKYDQSIHYYRYCLNDPIRRKFGLEALLETVKDVFGTRDLTQFENLNPSMEKIAAKMFQVVGHASFINMAFYTYPYIQVIRPSIFAHTLHFPEHRETERREASRWENRKFVTLVFRGLLPLLGVEKDSVLFKDMIEGVNQMTMIISLLDHNTGLISMPKILNNKGDPGYDEFKSTIEGRIFINNYCPPTGSVRMDMTKVFEEWLGKGEFRIDYYDLMALKYFHALQLCFEYDRSKPPKNAKVDDSTEWTYQFTYPKTAFIALWLMELFWDYHSAADTLNILNSWNVTPEALPENVVVGESFALANTDSEWRCLLSLWLNLGYMPSARYLITTQGENPEAFIQNVEDKVEATFRKISNVFEKIPDSEISYLQKYMGRIVFGREMYIDFTMPLPGGMLDESYAEDSLPFTEDHLHNTLIAVKYTIEKARQNWLGATNTQPTAKWWGDGEPHEIRYHLLDLREPMVVTAPFKEKHLAANDGGAWETFMGYPHTNYLLFPLSMINEPYVNQTMAVFYGGNQVKVIRAFLQLVSQPVKPGLYRSLPFWYDIVDFGNPETDHGANRHCQVLHNRLTLALEDQDKIVEFLYKYSMANFTTFHFSWVTVQSFFNVLAVKLAFKEFQKEKKALRDMPYNWTLDPDTRYMRMQRFFPTKKMEDFNEEQLFFITYVRNQCRGSWKTHHDAYRADRFFLETQILAVLMQTEEFSDVWKCAKDSFMNNLGKDRCLRWKP